MKKKRVTIIFILIFLGGLSLLLYPAISNYWNSFHASQAVSSYREAVDSLSEKDYQSMLAAAEAYNTRLSLGEQDYYPSDGKFKEYSSLLNPDGNGMMGYVEIPSIGVELPIYHGTAESVLQAGAGHLEWTSLPVGGESTHCVLSGHRGLPSARLFTDLDRLVAGDTFTVTVLKQTLTYEIDNIITIEPDQAEKLEIQQGKDLCTLMTCTPYGINTHRLLVQGHRVPDQENLHVSSEAVQIEPVMVMPFVAFPLLVISFIIISRLDKKKKRYEGDNTDENTHE